MRFKNSVSHIVILLTTLVLTACGGGNDGASNNDNNPATPGNPQATYQVTVSNITHAQVLTPLGIVLHRPGYSAWNAGSSVTVGLENLAESGDPSPFISEADLNANVDATAAGTSPFTAGNSQTVTVTADAASDLELTVATMLANTNDALTGVTNWSVGSMQVGDVKTVMPHVFDAGTEDNIETAATMPGPAAGGEGFNAARSVLTNVVTIHPGVVTQADGLATSALTEVDRWLGPAALITVTRTQ